MKCITVLGNEQRNIKIKFKILTKNTEPTPRLCTYNADATLCTLHVFSIINKQKPHSVNNS